MPYDTPSEFNLLTTVQSSQGCQNNSSIDIAMGIKGVTREPSSAVLFNTLEPRSAALGRKKHCASPPGRLLDGFLLQKNLGGGAIPRSK